MPSPFPGMDPFLEVAEIWEDFHANLATEIQRQLAPRLRPRYFAALTPRLTYDEVVIQEKRTAKPDVSVFKTSDRPLDRGGPLALVTAPMTGYVTLEVPVKEQSIEIHEAGTGLLVTVIEILSPVNKRAGHEAFETYRRKRRAIFRSSTHLLEIDLLRGGERPPFRTALPDKAYFVFLSREEIRPRVEIWPLGLRDPLPVVPVPLLAPDRDVPIDLSLALRSIYDQVGYDLRIDYRSSIPPPPLPAEEDAWAREVAVQAAREG